MTEIILQNLEEELATQMVNEYTETLIEEPILPPPPSHGKFIIICTGIFK